MIEALQQILLDPRIWGIILVSACYGVFMGAVPGLTATMAVALLVPVTYFLKPEEAIAAVVTVAACAIFAGDIPCALLRIPGTPASAAFADDAYALTRQGKSDQVLGVCLLFSVAGGLVGAVILILFAQTLAGFATKFSVVEYFWLYLLGLSCAVIVSSGSALRGMFGLVLGLLFSTVGLSAVHTEARFTFGRPEMFQGINFIPAMIGLFGLSEILRNLASPRADEHLGSAIHAAETAHTTPPRGVWNSMGATLRSAMPLLWKQKAGGLRSSGVGSLVGMLPGAGADIGSWVSMAVSKRFSKTPQAYGKGSIEGIADASAAKSSALAGTWVPALVFGIPGDSITAIVLGILLMKNITPGPAIFETQSVLVWKIYIIFILASLILLPIGLLAIKAGGYLIRVPRRVLLPIILLFCVLGSYAINGSYFDVGLMAGMGILGFILERKAIPLGPVVLGIILGGPLEERFIQTLTGSEASLAAFFSRPIAAVLGILTLLLWLAPILSAARRKRAGAPPSAP